MSNTIPWNEIESLLPHVQKPGRYVGGEYNAVVGDWDNTALHVCLAFPDLYDLGMSNYALAILYAILNGEKDFLAHRTFLPAPDMITLMREKNLLLYTLEDYHKVAEYDILAISTAYEQLYTNTLELLDLAGLPIHSEDRNQMHPLVIGGGHGTFNPEPITDFFDAFVIGEAEDVILEIGQVMRELKTHSRNEQLHALQHIEGIYIPRLFDTSAPHPGKGEGSAHAHKIIRKRLIGTLPPTPIRQIVPNIDTVHNRAIVEIHRGCTRGCRFCQAGTVTRPIRERPVEEIVKAASAIIDNTGYNEIALLSLSSADYSNIQLLVERLLEVFEGRHVTIALPSLRIESFSVNLADMLSQGRHSGFTFAPEAGSESLRYRINKNITDAELLSVAEDVFSRGWRTLKLYFMIGLPGETDDDVDALIKLVHQVRHLGMQIGGRKVEVHVSISTFVPKPHTPFQWEPLADERTIERRQNMLRERLRGRGLRLSWNEYALTQLEALLARGDRKLNAVVEQAWRYGARFDAWDEWQNLAAWHHALREAGEKDYGSLEELFAYYLYRQQDSEAWLPWDHLSSGVDKQFLMREYRNSQQETLLNDCREECHACGILRNYREFQTEAWKCPVLQ